MSVKDQVSRLQFQTLAPSLGTLLAVIFAITYLGIVITKRFAVLHDDISASASATRSLLLIAKLRGDVKERLLLYRHTHKTKYLGEIDDAALERSLQTVRFGKELRRVGANDFLIDSYIGGAQIMKGLEGSMLDAIATHQEKTASRLFDDYSDLYDINSARLADLHALSESRLTMAESEMNRLLNRLPIILIAIFILATGAAYAMTLFYRNRVLRPLNLLHKGLSAVSQGQLGLPLDVPPSATEIREMLRDFNQMTAKVKSTTEDLIQAREAAMRAASVKSEFLSNMSHEIRTPLNVIIGLADLIYERTEDRYSRCEVEVLRKSGEMLLTIVNDILDYSRLESGHVTVAHDAFNLHDLINGVVAVIEPLAERKDLNIAAQISVEVPRQVFGDSQLLEQALFNLVNNAVKFTLKGGVTVQARVVRTDSRERLELSVIDTGIGIAPDKVDNLFLRFERGDRSITRTFGGTGLGLAIVKQVINLLQGQIHVHSKEGRGSNFTLSLPYESAENAALVPKLQSCAPASGNFTGLDHAPVILVADDSEDNRFVIQHFLDPTSAQMIEAANGAQAVAAFKERKFDLVFMDIQMPVMDGYQATREIRKYELETHQPHTPVVALTAFALKEEVERSFANGCDAHVTKPLRKTELMALVQKFISKKHLQLAERF